jgi:hypothetical protein
MPHKPTSPSRATVTESAISPTRRALLLGGLGLFVSWRGLRARDADSSAQRYLRGGMPYAAFDELPTTTIELSGGKIQAAFAPGEFELPKPRILSWVKSSAETVAVYYGRFPVPLARLLVVPYGGGGVGSGNAFGYAGAAIRVRVGRDTSERQLDRDWVLVHEMVHLAFPSVQRRHHWIEEGLATYVEGIARVQAGRMRADELWAGMVDGMPNGLPKDGDRGLDHTPTWGRTYWGGALFCLLADVGIRDRTGNRKGLQDALRAILAAGGNMETTWPITKAFRLGDAATGVPVLMTLYREMRDAPAPVDLPALWRRLGVAAHGRGVVFSDDAPLAAVRRGIMLAPRLT